jgi:hypothetical protein
MSVFESLSYWAAARAVPALAAFSLAACSTLVAPCGPDYRDTSGGARVADLGDTIRVDVSVAFNENSGSSYLPDRQLVITVESVQAPVLPPAPAALVGHVPSVRLQTPAGAVLYRATVIPPMKDEPTLVGITVNNSMPKSVFDDLRNRLLANQLVVVLETDNSSLQMRPTPVTLHQSTGWRKATCNQ